MTTSPSTGLRLLRFHKCLLRPHADACSPISAQKLSKWKAPKAPIRFACGLRDRTPPPKMTSIPFSITSMQTSAESASTAAPKKAARQSIAFSRMLMRLCRTCALKPLKSRGSIGKPSTRNSPSSSWFSLMATAKRELKQADLDTITRQCGRAAVSSMAKPYTEITPYSSRWALATLLPVWHYSPAPFPQLSELARLARVTISTSACTG